MEEEIAREHQKPVDQILGLRTLAIVKGFDSASAVLISRKVHARTIYDAKALTGFRKMSSDCLEQLRAILLDPASYWNGWPIYRRFPPRPDFAIDVELGEQNLSLMIDLQNPGWIFSSGTEYYWGFNFARRSLLPLAKSLFSEFASPNKSSVWKKGAIAQLERMSDITG